MKIKHGMILAAGLGKRMQPLTLKTPKPLLKIGSKNLLERALNLLIDHGVSEISINIYHFSNQIVEFISNHNPKANISFSNEERLLLDTGGGVKEGTNNFKENPFFIINPDTLWNLDYSEELKSLENLYAIYKKPSLLLVNKKLSMDKSFKGDFNLKNKVISKDSENNFIFTGLQIMNRNHLDCINKKVFSMNEVWNKFISKNELYGFESKQKFYHLNTENMYNKISALNFTD